jgi:hypothetical protein
MCRCLESLEKRQLVTDFADLVVNDVCITLGGHCPEMMEFGVEQVVIRLIHVLASIRHYEREVDDIVVFDEVGKILHSIEKKSPGLLNLVIQEYRAKENVDARH